MSPPTESIPFSRPSIGPEEEAAVLAVLRSGWLTTGNVCAGFEKEFALRAGVPHALAVSSATAGLHLALEAVGVRRGTRVALSPYTFAASAEVVRYLGADPLFVDIEEDTLNLSPQRLEAALRRHRRVAAVMPVHIAGLPCRMEAILERTGARGIPVVEDAAHTLPWLT
ncbi:MAG: DegT/DnrJ/EryC1/StrS aminotransferase family protein, partial [Spirochaetales bacterium]|nr:DegT/DnrJ/EryC1/StrS aminotransferase family protein [Spirochaetales bacterium]